MDEKKMTLEELIGWLDDNDVSYEIDDAGKLTVKGDLTGNFRDWVRTHECTSLPGELVHVDGNLWLERTSITSLGNLASVGWSLDLRGTPITSLGNLTSVGRTLYLEDAPLNSLGNLTSVRGDLDLKGAPITSLDNLTYVGGYLDLRGAPITSLSNLTSVGKWFDLRGAPITSLGNLTSVGWFFLCGTSVTSLDDLPQVRNHLYLDQSQFQLLTREVLQKVTGGIRYPDQVKDTWVTLSPTELEAIIAENERRESLHNTRGSDVDWDLYDR